MAKEIKALNAHLQQQMNNLKRNLRYIFVNLQLIKVYIFINKSFANNKNLSSQIGFVLVIDTELKEIAKFILIKNIIYISSTKWKKVTRAMLASKLYIIAARINMLITLLNIINMIIDKFGIK